MVGGIVGAYMPAMADQRIGAMDDYHCFCLDCAAPLRAWQDGGSDV
jgi:hypothetical protein